MKLTIFGATGRTGMRVVEQALVAGHDVVAFVRNPAKLTVRHSRLRVVQGDLTDAVAIEDVVRGADAVLATLTPNLARGSKDMPVAAGTRHIVAAMRTHGVRRLVFRWGPSILIPRGPLTRALSRASYALLGLGPESREVGEAIRGSDLDWTTVVVTMPHDKPGTGRIKVRGATAGAGDRVRWRISRADLTTFMLAQADDLRYARQELRISN